MRFCLLLVLAAALAGCAKPATSASEHRVLVLGFDGVDPNLLNRFMAAGELPNFAKLAAAGSYIRLGTTIPPQSPVAWSTFITGLDPGGHGIYDFVHRDPSPPGGEAILPYLSTSRVDEDETRLTFGRYALPLRSGKTELLRHGKAFWNVLAEHGVPATVLKIPANFPPEPSSERTLSDMGTPDLRGTYGTFSFYSSDPADGEERSVSGGLMHPIRVADNHARSAIPGPDNPFRRDREHASRAFDIYVDPQSDAVKIEIGGEEILLQTGEWSDWVHVQFDLAPLASVHGIVRFHLLQVKPYLRLYTTPVNIDPESPALPISTPADYVQDLFENAGPFYTQGLPESTSALTDGVLDDGDWLAQADDIYAERKRLFDFELSRFHAGLLFAYFGGTDQVAHMFWRTLDLDGEGNRRTAHADAILNAYRQVDTVLGEALAAITPNGGAITASDTTLIVMSDHGFAPFKRAANLNSWLRAEGFVALLPGVKVGRDLFRDFDWGRTRAYGLGLNGLYLNLRGRERFGIVDPSERDAVLADLTKRLLAWRDPKTGENVVARVYRREEVYSPKYRNIAPDLIVGYQRGYRVSNESALGEVPEALIEDNTKKWSGDHCIAAEEVPGVLLSNRPVREGHFSLMDLAPTILHEFGIKAPEDMTGRPLLRR
jgi:predicted AlkP superfamily phosphohydrolase/phosphomutase